MTEHDEQVALFEWAGYASGRYPGLALLHAIPNGGHRHKAVAAKMRAEGVRAGVPDICLPVPRGEYHGLYLELKVGPNRPTESQEWWLQRLRERGYATAVAWGFDEARDVLEHYLQFGEILVTRREGES